MDRTPLSRGSVNTTEHTNQEEEPTGHGAALTFRTFLCTHVFFGALSRKPQVQEGCKQGCKRGASTLAERGAKAAANLRFTGLRRCRRFVPPEELKAPFLISRDSNFDTVDEPLRRALPCGVCWICAGPWVLGRSRSSMSTSPHRTAQNRIAAQTGRGAPRPMMQLAPARGVLADLRPATTPATTTTTCSSNARLRRCCRSIRRLRCQH